MLRALAKQLASHGRRVFEGIVQKGGQGAKANPRNKDFARFGPEQQNTEASRARYFVRLDASSRHSQSTWVQRLTGSSKTSLVQNLRQKVGDITATALQSRSQELVTGRKLISLYALVGLTMKAGSRKIELEDAQFDHICQDIKTLMEPRIKSIDEELPSTDIQLCNLQLGPLIAKGSNSAVYSARLCSDQGENDTDETESFEIINEEVYNDVAIVTEQDLVDINQEWQTRSDITIWDNLENSGTSETPLDDSTMNLAVKMMFNYDTESDSDTILRAMQNETVPCQMFAGVQSRPKFENGYRVKNKQLDPHPNVVDIRGVFVDEIPDLEDALSLYPDALPPRLNPDGSGHNITMFLVMKRYDTTLRGYLEQHTPSLKESLFLLAQLLEAVVHLNEQQIAHRDLKSDNILLDGSNLDLVVSDFGCCLADSEHGLKIPFTSRYTDKGGNVALMAPEIVCAEPVCGNYLDYSASDLWTVGTLAYEIFGCDNPFYRNSSGRRFDSRKYSVEELPSLPDHVPSAIRRLIKSILSRNPKKRPNARAAANLIHLYLWAPECWLSSKNTPTKLDLTRWLLLETAGVMCHRSWTIQTNPLLSLKQCFLSRSSMDGLLQGFDAAICGD